LRQQSWEFPEETLHVSALPGGVSNYVWKVVTPEVRWILKQPLPKLATEVEWYSDIRRIEQEQACIRFLSTILPKGTVPEIVHFDSEHHICVMTCAPAEAVSWKEHLMNGRFEASVGFSVGLILRQIQESSLAANGRSAFEELTFFNELRIDPFHHYLIAHYPVLKEPIDRLVDELLSRRYSLTHGDYSPKNILIDPAGAVTLLDFEVAHWGHPLFDVSFCLGHLMLKGWALRLEAHALAVIQAFLRGYGQPVDGLIPHIGLLLLARLDGKSPMPYVQGDALRNRIRKTAMDWIQYSGQDDPLDLIKSAWQLS
jgi:5-methylthioribose kinase